MKKKHEFSKLLIICLMSTYFVVLLLGIFVVVRILILSPEYSVQALIALFGYVAPVIAFSIKWYFTSKTTEHIHQFPDIQTVEQYKQMYGDYSLDTTIPDDSQTDIKG